MVCELSASSKRPSTRSSKTEFPSKFKEPMETYIHSTAKIGGGSQLGHNSVISENVTIGENCRIGSGVIIHPDTVIGNNVRIDDHAVVGKLPMKAALSAITQEQKLPPCQIGDGVILG